MRRGRRPFGLRAWSATAVASSSSARPRRRRRREDPRLRREVAGEVPARGVLLSRSSRCQIGVLRPVASGADRSGRGAPVNDRAGPRRSSVMAFPLLAASIAASSGSAKRGCSRLAGAREESPHVEQRSSDTSRSRKPRRTPTRRLAVSGPQSTQASRRPRACAQSARSPASRSSRWSRRSASRPFGVGHGMDGPERSAEHRRDRSVDRAGGSGSRSVSPPRGFHRLEPIAAGQRPPAPTRQARG